MPDPNRSPCWQRTPLCGRGPAGLVRAVICPGMFGPGAARHGPHLRQNVHSQPWGHPAGVLHRSSRSSCWSAVTRFAHKTAVPLSVRKIRITPSESRSCGRVTLSASTAGSLTQSRHAPVSCLANCHARHNQRDALRQPFRTTARPVSRANSMRPTSLGDEFRF